MVAGPFRVARRDYRFVNPYRPAATALRTRVWYPRDGEGPHPLVVYSHGYFSTRRGAGYLAEALASRGYVVAAPDHPLTGRWAPWGPQADDVVNQPGDLRAVIDGVLGLRPSRRAFRGAVDAERIGVMGLSLGGMTATLAAYHPTLRDPRIAAAVSLAGPMTVFGPRFFETARVPFLMVAGGADVVVDYGANAPLVLERVPDGALVTIAGASHAGFDDAARLPAALVGNPDRVGCWWLASRLDLSRSPDVLARLGAPANGLVVPDPLPRVCAAPPPCRALPVARQQLVTAAAVTAFFDSRFAPDPDARRAAAHYLVSGLAIDFPQATVERTR